MVVKFIYALFVGLFSAFVVGAGIAAFYPEPEYPDCQNEIIYEEGKKLSDEDQSIQDECNDLYDKYSETAQNHNRNVALIVLILAVALLGVSVSYNEKLGVLGEGLMFGGIFTLLYGAIRGFDTGDDTIRFLIMVLALAIAMGFGYWKFVLPTQKKTAKK